MAMKDTKISQKMEQINLSIEKNNLKWEKTALL